MVIATGLSALGFFLIMTRKRWRSSAVAWIGQCHPTEAYDKSDNVTRRTEESDPPVFMRPRDVEQVAAHPLVTIPITPFRMTTTQQRAEFDHPARHVSDGRDHLRIRAK
jgi:hypothetical protein